MKDDAIVKALPRQRLDALHMVGSGIGAQADRDASASREIEQQRVFRIGSRRGT